MSDAPKTWQEQLDIVAGEPGEMIVWFDGAGHVTLNLVDLNGRPLVSICMHEPTLRNALDVRATLAHAGLPFAPVTFCNHRLTDPGTTE